MNQSKLDVVKQEMVRINIEILRISELKQMGMGEFNSDDHCIYYCGHESLRRNGVAPIVNERVWNAVNVKSLSVSDSLRHHVHGKTWGLNTSSGKNTGVGCHFLLQGISLTQGSNLCLLHLVHCRQILYH